MNGIGTLQESSLHAALKTWYAKPGDQFQFERKGFFCADVDSKPGKPVFNLTVSLRDSWAKIEKK